MEKFESKLNEETIMDLSNNFGSTIEEILEIEDYSNKVITADRLLAFDDEEEYERFITRCVMSFCYLGYNMCELEENVDLELVLKCYESVLEERGSDISIDDNDEFMLNGDAELEQEIIIQDCEEENMEVDLEITKLQRVREFINYRKDIK